MSPELQRLYALEQQRYTENAPLIEAAYRLAFNRLPPAARGDLAAPSYAEADAATPQVMGTGDGYAEAAPVRQALRAMEVRQRMAQPILQAISRLAQARMPHGLTPPPFTPRSAADQPTGSGLPPRERQV